MALWRQGFLAPDVTPAVAAKAGARRQEQIVRAMVDHLGAVQLDTISVLARSHELVAYARLGAVRRTAIESAYWSDASTFEYWSHAACIVPMHSWPAFAHRRRWYARRGWRWHEFPQKAVDDVLARLADGPVTTGDVGGAKKGGYWWDWSDAKIALEWLIDTGVAVCTRRVGWRRVYDLAERVVPADYQHGGPLVLAAGYASEWVEDDGVPGPTDHEGLRWLIADAAQSIGVGTTADIADVHRLKPADVLQFREEVGLLPVRVDGWKESWATQEALDWLASAPSGLRHRTTLLSPFDSLIWYRPRTERLFGMSHRLEAYTPAPKRVHGYFAMPVLHRGRLVARVDPKRDGGTLVAKRVTMESASAAARRGVALALEEAASWVGCDGVRIDEVR